MEMNCLVERDCDAVAKARAIIIIGHGAFLNLRESRQRQSRCFSLQCAGRDAGLCEHVIYDALLQN